MKNFLRYWFSGFDKAIQQIDPAAVEILLKECGEACSRSYTEEIFKEVFEQADNLDEFTDHLKFHFPELEIQKNCENKIHFIYKFCACNLVKNNLVSSPIFCQCSKASLQYNWESVLGKDHVDIIMLTSILSGDEKCEFLITIHQ